MQPECDQSILLFRILQIGRRRAAVVLFAIAFSAIQSGCAQNTTTIDPPREQPYRGQNLSVDCSSTIESTGLVEQYAREWEMRQSAPAAVHIDRTASFAGDVAIVTAAELPGLAETGRFVPVPDAITKSTDHPFQWDGLLPAYSGPIVSWGSTVFAVPLMGESHVLVYRKDRLAQANQNPPASWPEYVAVAKALAQAGKPSLPPLPKRPLDLDIEFNLIAASLDRRALSQAESSNVLKDLEAQDIYLSYHYRLKSGENRINAQSFVEALRIMGQLQKFRAKGEAESPVASLLEGNASIAIVSLADLYRLQVPSSAVRGNLGIAPVPGSRYTYDRITGKEVPTRGSAVNRIPYLGGRSLVGLVNKDCPNPTMAWEFVAGLATPDKTSAEVITAGKWGAGPFRYLHIEERGRFLWFGYDLSRDDTENLITALKDQVQPNVANPCFRLRLPNEKDHAREFDAVIRATLLSGDLDPKTFDPQKAMDQVAQRWNALWKEIPDAQRMDWIRKSYGLSGQ